MALILLLFSVPFVLSFGSGSGFAQLISDKIGVLKRKNQELAERIERLEHRIKARSAIIADLKKELDSYAAFSDSLNKLDSLKYVAYNSEECRVQENLIPRPSVQKRATLPSIKTERAKITHNFTRLNSKYDLTSSDYAVSCERDPAAINAVFNRHVRVLQDLYQQALKRDPDLKGSITLRFNLTRDGHVENIETVKSTLNFPELEQAVAEKVKNWKDFGKVSGGSEDRKYKKTLRFGE